MNLGNIILSLFVANELVLLFKLLISKNNREAVTAKNIDIEAMRSKDDLSLEEQKKYLDMRFGDYSKPFDWKEFLVNCLWYIPLIIWFEWVLDYNGIIVPWWQALAVALIGNLVTNLLLKKFNLHGQSTLFNIMRK